MTWGNPPKFKSVATKSSSKPVAPEQLAASGKRFIPDDVRIRQNAAKLAVRKARVAKGLCRDCGGWPHLKDKVVCRLCHIKRKSGNVISKNKKVLNGKCLMCSNPHERGTKFCNKCSQRQIENYRIRRKYNKEFIITYFGGKCKDCCEIDIRCLSLDHVNNDGKIDKLSDNGKKQLSPAWYAKLVKLIKTSKPLPRELQLLCFNCHAKKDLQPWWYKNGME